MGICARSARHTNLRVSMSVPLSILYLLIINLMEFLKVWAKHNFYYIRYISVYIQPRYFYLIFWSVNGNKMNRVILHSVRPSFWKKRAFSHAPRCGSTESGCEISIPWWLILADLGKMTSVWSRDRDTGDTSEVSAGLQANPTVSELKGDLSPIIWYELFYPYMGWLAIMRPSQRVTW